MCCRSQELNKTQDSIKTRWQDSMDTHLNLDISAGNSGVRAQGRSSLGIPTGTKGRT
jgi:hypothetical protein